MSAEWLFPDSRPFWDTSRPDMPYADCNWKGTTMTNTIEQPTIAEFPTEFTDAPKKGKTYVATKKPKPETGKPTIIAETEHVDLTEEKETPMPKKTAAAKTAEPKTATKKAGRKPRMTVAEVKERFESGVAEVRKLYGDAKPIEQPYNPAKPNGVLNRDPEWNEALQFIAADLGWTDNRFAYRGQILANGGKIREGAYGVPSFFNNQYHYVYNFGDVEWPDGKVPTEWKKTERKPRAAKKTPTKQADAGTAPVVMAPAPKLLHIKLANGIEFDAHDAAEVKELMALFA